MAHRVDRGIALLFHDRGTRRGWVVSSTPRPHFTPGKYLVPILQEAGWAPRSVWTGGKYRPHWDSIPDRPARSQSLYGLSYRAHSLHGVMSKNTLLKGRVWNDGACDIVKIYVPIPVAARSKPSVYGRSRAGIAGSNSAWGMDVCLVFVCVCVCMCVLCCVVR